MLMNQHEQQHLSLVQDSIWDCRVNNETRPTPVECNEEPFLWRSSWLFVYGCSPFHPNSDALNYVMRSKAPSTHSAKRPNSGPKASRITIRMVGGFILISVSILELWQRMKNFARAFSSSRQARSQWCNINFISMQHYAEDWLFAIHNFVIIVLCGSKGKDLNRVKRWWSDVIQVDLGRIRDH